MSVSDFLFGTTDHNAERELLNYRPGKGRTKDWGDHLGDWLTGQGSVLDKRVEELYVADLKKTYGEDIDALSALPGYEPLTLTKDTDKTVLERQIARRAPVLEALNAAQSSGLTLDTSTLGSKPTAGAIQGLAAKAERNRIEGKERKAEEKEQDRYEAEVLREEGRELRQDKRLAQERLLSAQTNQMNMQLEYARLAQADRQRATDRKDKALMMLIQGLGNLGGAFTI